MPYPIELNSTQNSLTQEAVAEVGEVVILLIAKSVRNTKRDSESDKILNQELDPINQSMYKTKVQELCQRRSWSLPDYKTTRDGPDHNPRFTSTVTVNGITFQTPSPFRTAKESQNNAAMLAFHHFSQPFNNPSPTPPPKPRLMLRPKPKPNPMSMSIPMPSPPPPPPPSFIQVPTIPGLGSFPQPTFLELPQPSVFDNFDISSSSTSSSYCSPGPSTDVNNILPTNRAFQQKLEGACETSQISSPVTADRDIVTTGDKRNMAHLYKNQLQSYAQKRNLKLPVYSSEWEGPPHAMSFKCKVTIDGQTYECPKFFSTLKDAEHAAAEVALMSLSLEGFQEDHTVLYKNLLQELVQREGFRLPAYSTEKSGEAHMPTFVSQVEVEGEVFTGQEAKTKKQAEMSAAKVAYTTLKECQGKSEQRSTCPLSDHQGKAPELLSGGSESNVITGLRHHGSPKHPVSPGVVSPCQPDKGKSEQGSLCALSDHQGKAPQLLFGCSESSVITSLQHNANPKHPVSPGVVFPSQPDKNKEPVVTMKKASSPSGNTNGCTKDSSLTNGQSAPSLSDSVPSTTSGTPTCKRVTVYSRETNMKIEEGGTLVSISDGKWVVYTY